MTWGSVAFLENFLSLLEKKTRKLFISIDFYIYLSIWAGCGTFYVGCDAFYFPTSTCLKIKSNNSIWGSCLSATQLHCHLGLLQ